MKLLLICYELGYRGTPRYLVNCATIAKTAGIDVLIWALEQGGPAKDECINLGIPVIEGLKDISKALSLKPDIIHIHRSGGVSHRDTALLRHLKSKCGCRIMETNVFGTADLTLNSPIDIHAHISRWDLWRWRKWFWPFRPLGIYLPYCVDTNALRPTSSKFRAMHNIPDDAILIGRLGKTDWNELARAVVPAMLKANNLFFATVNDYSDSPKDTVSWPKAIQSRIVRIPLLKGNEELSAFYSACDATLNFSPIGESFGYVVAESMSCGTPCIAHSKPRNDNAQIEVAALKFGGYPVLDSVAAEKTILGIVESRIPQERKSACRESIISRYSIQVFSSVLLKAYATLCNLSDTGAKLEKRYIDAGFETDIPTSEINDSLANVIGGKPSLLTRIKMRLAYSFPNAIRLHRICLKDFPSKVPMNWL